MVAYWLLMLCIAKMKWMSSVIFCRGRKNGGEEYVLSCKGPPRILMGGGESEMFDHEVRKARDSGV